MVRKYDVHDIRYRSGHGPRSKLKKSLLDDFLHGFHDSWLLFLPELICCSCDKHFQERGGYSRRFELAHRQAKGVDRLETPYIAGVPTEKTERT